MTWNRFTPQTTPELSYVIGVILGDGFVYKDKWHHYIVGLNAKDKDFVETFRDNLIKVINRTILHTAVMYVPSHKYYVTRVCCKEFVDWYKSLTWNDMIAIAEKYPENFLRGIADSEGGIRNNLTITNTNYTLLLFCKQLLSNFFIDSKIKEGEKKGTFMQGFQGLYLRKATVFHLYTCTITDLLIFWLRIGFSIKRKENNMRCYLTYSIKQALKYFKVLRLKKRRIPLPKIVKQTMIPETTVYYWITKKSQPYLVKIWVQKQLLLEELDLCLPKLGSV